MAAVLSSSGEGLTVALVPWGSLIEDFLGPIGTDLDGFVDEMTGGWLFGDVDALQRQGARAVVVCVSRAVSAPERRVHRGTGAPVWVLPAGRVHRLVHRAASGRGAGWRRAARAAARQVLPWCSTPLRGLAEVVRREAVTALVCQEHSEARFDVCLAVGRWCRVPVFSTFQGGDVSPTWLEARTRRWVVRRAAGVLVGSGTEAARLRDELGVPPAKLHDVPNPIAVDEWAVADRTEARRQLGIPADAQAVSWHGRVELHRKGLDLLLDAWRQLRRDPADGPPRLLLLTGTGPDAAAVHATVDAWADVAWRDDYVFDRAILRRQLAAADVAVLPSRHEGFAVALLEAMACGRAVVAAAVPGVRDVAPGGEADGCIVVPVGDAPALAEAIGALLDDPERARRLGAAGRRRVEAAFSTDAIGARLVAVLSGR